MLELDVDGDVSGDISVRSIETLEIGDDLAGTVLVSGDLDGEILIAGDVTDDNVYGITIEGGVNDGAEIDVDGELDAILRVYGSLGDNITVGTMGNTGHFVLDYDGWDDGDDWGGSAKFIIGVTQYGGSDLLPVF